MTRHRIQPRLDSLEARALMTAWMVESEPNNTPVAADVVRLDPVDRSGSVTGRLGPADRDFFRITSDVGGTLALNAVTSGGPARVDIFDPATGRRLQTGRISGQGLTTGVGVDAGSSVLIRLARIQNRGASAYQLNFSILAAAPAPGGGSNIPGSPSTPPGSGPNLPGGPSPLPGAPSPRPGAPTPGTTPSDAFAIGFDRNGRADIAGSLAPGDVDVYTFTAPRSGRLTLGPRGRSPIRVDALDAAGRPLLTIFGDLSSFISHFPVKAGQSYTLRVAPSARASGTVGYHIDLAISGRSF